MSDFGVCLTNRLKLRSYADQAHEEAYDLPIALGSKGVFQGKEYSVPGNDLFGLIARAKKEVDPREVARLLLSYVPGNEYLGFVKEVTVRPFTPGSYLPPTDRRFVFVEDPRSPSDSYFLGSLLGYGGYMKWRCYPGEKMADASSVLLLEPESALDVVVARSLELAGVTVIVPDVLTVREMSALLSIEEPSERGWRRLEVTDVSLSLLPFSRWVFDDNQITRR